MPERIRPEELAVYREAQLKAKVCLQDVELLQLRIFLSYGLKQGDSFNAETGIIARAAPELPPEPEHG